MADGADAAVEPVFFQFLQERADGAGVVGRVAQFYALFVAVDFKGDVGVGQVEFFGQAAQKHIAVVFVDDRAFERGAAAVQY